MVAGQLQRAEAIFLAALQRTPGERGSFIEQECAGDEALRSQILACLESHVEAEAGGFLAEPTVETFGGGVADAAAGDGAADRVGRSSGETARSSGEAASSSAEVARSSAAAARSSAHAAATDSRALSEDVGGRIGPYRLLERIGEGGFGSVYMAEQREPVHRRVALKIIKAGMDTRQVIARFEAERQALAMMDHPNIARVLDAGTTEAVICGTGLEPVVSAGRPYFVMELVRGVPITHFCDESRLAVRKRLELFVDVCHAVQHAHTKGVIHRDIKPSNVLVTLIEGGASASGRCAVPKVIDFGIAKATAAAGPLTDKTLLTEARQLIGTPEYMSPEQAQMGATDIDTRSDVYSLGVLLYELLTGVTPFDRKQLRESSLDDLRRIIREVEPPTPSTRVRSLSEPRPQGRGHSEPRASASGNPLSYGRGSDRPSSAIDIAQQRLTDPASLSGLLRGDLDWIVMKCLEKDRARRYETANGLAADVQRHLVGEPVTAAPPSRVYRMSKFVRRNRGAVITAGLVAVALLFGVAGTSAGLLWALHEKSGTESALRREGEQKALAQVHAKKAREEADRADAEADAARRQQSRAERVAGFMRDIFEGAAPSVALGRDTELLRKLMDGAAKRIRDGEMEGAPEIELELRLVIGDTFRQIAAYDAAHEMLQPTESLARLIHGEEDCQFAVALLRRAQLLTDAGQALEALPKFEEALRILQRVYEGDHPEVARSLGNVGWCLNGLRRSADALPALEASLEMRRRLTQGDDPDLATGLNNLGMCLQSLGRHDEALSSYQAALDMRQRLFKDDHPDVARSLNNLGACLDESLGRPAEALPRYHEALEMWRRLIRGDHPGLAVALNNVGHCLQNLGRPAEALPQYEAALEIRQRLFRGDHPDLANSLCNVGSCLQSLGKSGEALARHQAALEMRQRLFEGDHADVATSMYRVAGCMQSLGRLSEALPRFEEALAMSRRLFRDDHRDVASGLNALGRCLDSLGRPAEALIHYETALEMRQRLFQGDHVDVAHSLNNVGACLRSLGRPAAALPHCEAALAMCRRLYNGDHPNVATSFHNVALCLQGLERFDEALANSEAALEMRLRLKQTDHPDTATGMHTVAYCLQSTGRAAEALPIAEAALAMYARCLPSDHPSISVGRSLLGACLLDLERYADAQTQLLKADQGLRAAGWPAERTRKNSNRIVKLYEAWDAAEPGQGYAERAAEWRQRLEAETPAVAAPESRQSESGPPNAGQPESRPSESGQPP